jgi:vacuolar protein sorting-associated protein IST1
MKPKPVPRGKPANEGSMDFPDLPDLPTVPSTMPSDPNIPNNGKSNSNEENDIDFDDLTKRFEDLKKRK